MKRFFAFVAVCALVLQSAIAHAGGGGWSTWPRRRWILRDVPGNALVAEYDARKGVAVTGAVVDTWADQTGNAHTLSATLTARPTFAAAGINGTPELQCDGSNDVMTTGAFTLNQPETVIAVGASTAYGTLGVNDILWDGIVAGRMVLGSITNSSVAMSAGTSLSDATHTVPNGTMTRILAQYNGASGILNFIDTGAVERNTTGNVNTNNAGGLTLCALATPSRYYAWKWKHFAVFSSAVAAADLTIIKEWARWRMAN